MKVADAMLERHSCRAFLPRQVDLREIERILRLARHAPSGANTQPWHVAVVSGRAKQAIEHEIETRFRAGERGDPDYQYYPLQWSEPYNSRRVACGMQLYSALGIDRKDRKRRMEQWVENYRSFGAPVVLYFYLASNLEAGSYLDMGMFLQSVALLAQEAGLATCLQQALAEYPRIVKRELALGDGWVLVCGMAIGFEDVEAPVNRYRTPRAELEEFVRFYR